MKNLFFTGDINEGKSTVIKHLIKQINIKKEDIGGFYTRAYLENDKVKGFYIEPINFSLKNPDIKNKIIGYTPDGIRWIGVTNTFEGFGVDILDYCINCDFKLIVMDELGFFENEAYRFQQKVHEILSSDKKILGVIKPLSTPFMDSIRKRKDVIEVEITRNNRETMPRRLADKFIL